MEYDFHKSFAGRPSWKQTTAVPFCSLLVPTFVITASTNVVPKSAVKKNRRDKQKQSRDDEETAGVEDKVVWRTREEILTLYDGIQAKHQQGDSCVSYGT